MFEMKRKDAFAMMLQGDADAEAEVQQGLTPGLCESV